MALKEFLILRRPRSGSVALRDAAARRRPLRRRNAPIQRLCHWITASIPGTARQGRPSGEGIHGKRWNVDLWMPPRAGMTPWVPKYMPSFWVGFSGFADDLAT
jgi:hypothetical protein